MSTPRPASCWRTLPKANKPIENVCIKPGHRRNTPTLIGRKQLPKLLQLQVLLCRANSQPLRSRCPICFVEEPLLFPDPPRKSGFFCQNCGFHFSVNFIREKTAPRIKTVMALQDAYLKAVWGNAPDPQWFSGISSRDFRLLVESFEFCRDRAISCTAESGLCSPGRYGRKRLAACLIPCCGGVGGFFVYPSFQLRKCRPAPRYFNFGQTLMPEFHQSPFYINKSRRQKGPVSYIAGLWCWRLRGVLPRCVTKFLRSGGGSGNRSRSCGFRLKEFLEGQ